MSEHPFDSYSYIDERGNRVKVCIDTREVDVNEPDGNSETDDYIRRLREADATLRKLREARAERERVKVLFYEEKASLPGNTLYGDMKNHKPYVEAMKLVDKLRDEAGV